jgi:septum site-determining protein MinC
MVPVTIAVRPRNAFRFRGRSFLALVLSPEAPVAKWLGEIDAWLLHSPGFFAGKPLVLDLAGLVLTQGEFASLVADLNARDIRIMGVENADPSCLQPGLPPLLTGGRSGGIVEVTDGPSAEPAAPPAPPASSLLIDAPVRSGQSIIFPDGDVTVVGSVASGAEIIAKGSIHVYGALRGRALAGAYGNPGARIFASRLEAELLAIDGYYKVADEMEPRVRKKPVQAALESGAMIITILE